MNVTKKHDFIPKEKRNKIVNEIITYYKTKMDQEIGVVVAEDILDFFLEAIGNDIYNKAISDSKNTIKNGFEIIEVDLDLLLNK